MFIFHKGLDAAPAVAEATPAPAGAEEAAPVPRETAPAATAAEEPEETAGTAPGEAAPAPTPIEVQPQQPQLCSPQVSPGGYMTTDELQMGQILNVLMGSGTRPGGTITTPLGVCVGQRAASQAVTYGPWQTTTPWTNPGTRAG